jgi:hypothetical protein
MSRCPETCAPMGREAHARRKSGRMARQGARHRQRDAEHRPHRGEHRRPDASLLHIHRARQPRVSSEARFALKAKTFSQARSVRSRYYINVADDQLQAASYAYTDALERPFRRVPGPGSRCPGSVPVGRSRAAAARPRFRRERRCIPRSTEKRRIPVRSARRLHADAVSGLVAPWFEVDPRPQAATLERQYPPAG